MSGVLTFFTGAHLGPAFIAPGLYEPYQNGSIKAIDEYTLSQAMGDDLAEKMEEHYRTFIVCALGSTR